MVRAGSPVRSVDPGQHQEGIPARDRAAPSMSVSRRSPTISGRPPPARAERRLEDRRVRLAHHLRASPPSSPRSPPAVRRRPATAWPPGAGKEVSGFVAISAAPASTCKDARPRAWHSPRPRSSPTTTALGHFGAPRSPPTRGSPRPRRRERLQEPGLPDAPAPDRTARRASNAAVVRADVSISLASSFDAHPAQPLGTTAPGVALALFVTKATPLPASRIAPRPGRCPRDRLLRLGRARRRGRTGTRRSRSIIEAAIDAGPRYTRCMPRISPFQALVFDAGRGRSAGAGHRSAVRRHLRPSPARVPVARARSASSISTSPKASVDPTDPESRYSQRRRAAGGLGDVTEPWSGCRGAHLLRLRDAVGPDGDRALDPGAGLRDGSRTLGGPAHPPRTHDARPGGGSSVSAPRDGNPPLPRVRHDRGPVSSRLASLLSTAAESPAARPPWTSRASSIGSGRSPPTTRSPRGSRAERAADRRRTPSVHDRAAATARTPCRGRAGTVGPRADPGRRCGHRAATVLPFHRIQTFRRDARRRTDRCLTDWRPPSPPARTTTVDRWRSRPSEAQDGIGRIRSIQLAGEAPAVRALHEELLDRRRPDRRLAVRPRPMRSRGSGRRAAARRSPPTSFRPPRRTASARSIDRGERLPQKSTYFWPKPRTGMVMMPLDPPPSDPGIDDRPGRAPAS